MEQKDENRRDPKTSQLRLDRPLADKNNSYLGWVMDWEKVLSPIRFAFD